MKKSRILLTICIIGMILIFFMQSTPSHNELNTVRKDIVDDISPDNKHRLVLTEYGETYPLGASTVELYVAYKDKEKEWNRKKYFTFDVANEGGVSKENFRIEWIKDGVIIHVEACDQQDILYRVYWKDLFKE